MKKIVSVLLAAMMLTLTACAGNNTSVSESTSTEAVVSVEETVNEEAVTEEATPSIEEAPLAEEAVATGYAVTYPVTVVDMAGREVTLEKRPERIVSGYYISSSLLIALDVDDRLVGIEAKANKRPIYKLSAESLIELPSVGSAKEFDLEGCIALEPDLVILPKKLKDAAKTMEELGITVVLVNPENEEDLLNMAHLVAVLTDSLEREAMLVDFITSNKEMLKSWLASEEVKSVYLAGNSDFLSTASKGMYQTDMIELAGGKNVASEIDDTYWVEVSYEQVLAWNPEYIVIAAEAEYDVEDVLANEALAECDAVVNKNVYKLPSNAEAWDSPVPSSILGSVWLANVLHEDKVGSDNALNIIEEFYETFYDFKYSEN